MATREDTSMKAIPYYRVSTQKQGKSGLGLEAQRKAVEDWAKTNQAQIIPVPPYVEVESGKKTDRERPKLAAAIAHAKASRAVLVVAKLDRLARNVAFLSALMEAGVTFVCVDNPSATPLTIHILAAVAEDEAKRISERTRSALAAYKARGGLLGASRPECRNLTADARERGSKAGVAAKKQKTATAYDHVRPLVMEMRASGLSLQSIADRMNTQGYVTRSGKPWNRVQVMRLANVETQP
jgi:DNA invertase Pin-like site-specific DNA recombinase